MTGFRSPTASNAPGWKEKSPAAWSVPSHADPDRKRKSPAASVAPSRSPEAEPPSDDAAAQTWHYSAEAVVIRRLATRGKETQMGLDDLAKKAGDALSSDKAEAISDKALDAAAGAAKKATGGKYDDKIDAARDAVDGKLGTE